VRWPRKNDSGSIRTRQEIVGLGGLPLSVALEPFAAAAEALTGVAVIPVSVCPLTVELGAYELSDEGELAEVGRAAETVHVPSPTAREGSRSR
jgi:hypothetical protein